MTHWTRSEILFLAWLAIAGALGALLAGRTRRMHRLLREFAPVERPELLALFGAMCARSGLRQPIELRVASGELAVGGPMVIGIRRPVVILPCEMAGGWSLADLEPVLLHELAHVRRRDLWVNWVQAIVQIVYFFHPLVWLANWQIRRERELVCDDLAVAQLGGQRAAYSRSIMRVIEETQNGSPLTAGIGMAERHSSLGRRIVRIMDRNYRSYQSLGWASLCALALLGLVCVALASDPLNAQPQPAAPAAPATLAPTTAATPVPTPLTPTTKSDDTIDTATRLIGEEVHKRITAWTDVQTLTIANGQSAEMKLKDNPTSVAALRLTPKIEPNGMVFETVALDAAGKVISRRPTNSGVIHDGNELRSGVDHPMIGDFFCKFQLKPTRLVDGQIQVEVKVLFAKPPTSSEIRALLMTKGKEGRTHMAFQDAGMAILLYRQRQRRYPASFAEMLKDAPKDPYSPLGEAIHYEPHRTRFILSSCGEDGVYGNDDDQIFIGEKEGSSSGLRHELYPLPPEPAGEIVDAQEERLGPSGRRPTGNCQLAGKVIDEKTSQPVGGATVYLYCVDTLDAIFITTPTDGTFVYKDIPPGNYALSVINTAGYQKDAAYNPENTKGQQSPQFKLKDKEERSGVVIALKKACQISGRVTNEAGQPPADISDLQVSVWGESRPDEGYSSRYRFLGQSIIQPDGTYTLDGLDGRPIYVVAQMIHDHKKDDAYPMRYYPGTFAREEAKLVTFDTTSVVGNIDIQLAKHGGLVLEGTITDEAGTPIPKALIYAHHQDMLFDRVAGYSDDAGKYRLECLGPGDLLVHVDASPGNFIPTRKPFAFKADASPAHLDITLRKGVTISGKFVDEQGKDLTIVQKNHVFGYGTTQGAVLPNHSFTGLPNRFGPTRLSNGSVTAYAGEGDYPQVSMFFPTASTFMVQGVAPGQVMLNFNPYTPGKQVLLIDHQGKDVLKTGIAAKAGDVINDVQIVVGPPPAAN